MTIKKKLPDEVKDMLRGYSATFGTYTLKIGEDDLGENAPEFTMKNLTVGDLRKVSNGITDNETVFEIVRSHMISAKNIFDYDAGEMVDFVADPNGGCDSDFFEKIPANIIVTIFHDLQKLNVR